MRNLVIIGAGMMATSIVDQFNLEERVVQYYEAPREVGENKMGMPVKLEFDNDPSKYEFIAIIGDTRRKRELIKGLGFFEPLKWINIIAVESAYIVKSVEIGKGNLIQIGTNILARAKIGNHNLICEGTRIAHDCVIGNYCTLSSEVALGGNCTIGDGVLIGVNATLLPGVKVGNGAIVGAGAVATKSVPPNHVVIGNPARDLNSMESWDYNR